MAQVSKRKRRWQPWCLLSILLALLGSWVVIDNDTRQAVKQHKIEVTEALKSRPSISWETRPSNRIAPQRKESPFRLLAAIDSQRSE